MDILDTQDMSKLVRNPRHIFISIFYKNFLQTEAKEAKEEEKEEAKSEEKPKKKTGCNTEEILAVLAHELGHWSLNHVLKNFFISQVECNSIKFLCLCS